jgi:hypothetical protein
MKIVAQVEAPELAQLAKQVVQFAPSPQLDRMRKSRQQRQDTITFRQ